MVVNVVPSLQQLYLTTLCYSRYPMYDIVCYKWLPFIMKKGNENQFY